MKTIFILHLGLFWLISLAVNAQYKDSSRVAIDSVLKAQSVVVKSQSKQSSIDLKTPTGKKKQSEYIYEKGQISGGRTTWKWSKKKKQ